MFALEIEPFQQALDTFDVEPAHVGIAHGGLQGAMAQKGLDVSDICTTLQKTGGIAVAKQMNGAPFINTRRSLGIRLAFFATLDVCGNVTLLPFTKLFVVSHICSTGQGEVTGQLSNTISGELILFCQLNR